MTSISRIIVKTLRQSGPLTTKELHARLVPTLQSATDSSTSTELSSSDPHDLTMSKLKRKILRQMEAEHYIKKKAVHTMKDDGKKDMEFKWHVQEHILQRRGVYQTPDMAVNGSEQLKS